MGVVAGAGLLIGVAAVYQTPLYTNGFLLLGGVTVPSFTTWSDWRSWVLPILALMSVLMVSIGISTGLLNVTGRESRSCVDERSSLRRVAKRS
jgi:hypothetical protein